MSLLETLAEKKIIQREDVSRLLDTAKKNGEDVEALMVKEGVDENVITATKGELLGIPVKSVGKSVPFETLKFIPEESARHYRFVPVGVEDNVLQVGMLDPDNIEAMDALQFISSKVGMPFKVFLVSTSDFNTILEGYKGLSGEVSNALSELETELSGDVESIENEENAESQEQKNGQAMRIVEDAPVTKMVAVMLRHATEGNASDIHIEHTGEKVRVRFRVDGELYTSIFLPVSVHPAVVARIKILSNLKLDEKRKPQDGRFSAKIDGRKIDFRVSTFPAYYGEKVVMRILDTEKGVKALDKLNLRPENLEAIRNAIVQPYGLILVTGPTGSGKSTTLYSMLNELDREGANIISLEDPVEYNIPGINQSQVRPEIGYTFASGLRSILRQDPDIIMVGEIRDKETAALAVQAALTGHLVLSTLHTNTAAGIIPRLIDMQVDPYLIAPTLILAIGQRLVQSLCPGAGKEVPLSEAYRRMIEKQFSDLPPEYRSKIKLPNSVYEAMPTADCPTGTKGREAVFEVLKVDGSVERVILENPVEPAVFQAARKQGMLTMKEDAILKAFAGEIPFVEVNSL